MDVFVDFYQTFSTIATYLAKELNTSPGKSSPMTLVRCKKIISCMVKYQVFSP